jgi:pyruvyltransferase
MPEIYGDPALLLPKYYLSKVKKKIRVGIIPHYVDKNNPWIKKISKEEGVLILDIKKITKILFKIYFPARTLRLALAWVNFISDAYKIKMYGLNFPI